MAAIAFAVDITLTDASTSDHRRLTLKPGRFIDIGRTSRSESKNLLPSTDNALFDCAVVSRRHARMTLNAWADPDRQVMLRDLASKHGTMVNGKKLDSNTDCYLRSGDRIKLGGEITVGHESHDGITLIFEQSRSVLETQAPETASPAQRGFRAPSYDSVNDDDDDDDHSVMSISDDELSALTTPEQVKPIVILDEIATCRPTIQIQDGDLVDVDDDSRLAQDLDVDVVELASLPHSVRNTNLITIPDSMDPSVPTDMRRAMQPADNAKAPVPRELLWDQDRLPNPVVGDGMSSNDREDDCDDPLYGITQYEGQVDEDCHDGSSDDDFDDFSKDDAETTGPPLASLNSFKGPISTQLEHDSLDMVSCSFKPLYDPVRSSQVHVDTPTQDATSHTMAIPSIFETEAGTGIESFDARSQFPANSSESRFNDLVGNAAPVEVLNLNLSSDTRPQSRAPYTSGYGPYMSAPSSFSSSNTLIQNENHDLPSIQTMENSVQDNMWDDQARQPVALNKISIGSLVDQPTSTPDNSSLATPIPQTDDLPIKEAKSSKRKASDLGDNEDVIAASSKPVKRLRATSSRHSDIVKGVVLGAIGGAIGTVAFLTSPAAGSLVEWLEG